MSTSFEIVDIDSLVDEIELTGAEKFPNDAGDKNITVDLIKNYIIEKSITHIVKNFATPESLIFTNKEMFTCELININSSPLINWDVKNYLPNELIYHNTTSQDRFITLNTISVASTPCTRVFGETAFTVKAGELLEISIMCLPLLSGVIGRPLTALITYKIYS